jgi:prophage maintenance system killer protein
MFIFLALNGFTLDPAEDEIVEAMVAVAESKRAELWLAGWAKRHSLPCK